MINSHRRAYRSSLIVPTSVALAALATLSTVACRNDAPSSSAVNAGSISLAVQAGTAAIDQVSYTITGPGAFNRAGNIDVHASATISAVITAIPAATGYTVALSAASRAGDLTCAGMTGFDVAAGKMTMVVVRLLCHESPRTGSVGVNGIVNICPAIDGLGATPAEVMVGGTLTASAQAHDADHGPMQLTYAWTSSGGTLGTPTAATTTFTCTAPGPVTLTLTASDGDAAPGCADTQSLTVNCTAPTSASACALSNGAGPIQHVIYIQFDNTHLRRDRAAVPSDLEQMPHLLSFIRDNGTMMANDHTILISHTAGGILSSLTGVYPDRHGQTVSNSYVRTSATGGFSFPSSFGYWTDPVAGAIPNMVGPDGGNIPAPWPVFTRAGCDVGAVATANIVLENTGTGATGDVTKVFGAGSPQFAEAMASAAAPSGSAARVKAQTDLVGFAVHCAAGSPVCAGGQDDLLPSEPGGYTGFKGLFGAQAIDPLLTGAAPTVALNDLAGQPITDPFGQPGFPGFDGMSAAASLAYVAAMQEHGIPVTYAYISDAHDFHGVAGNAHTAFGPGSAGYVAQLKAYDDAFAAFFARLAADGLDRSNTLFVFTVDEGDHFVGGTPTPADCDGVTTPCDWTNQVGELNANIDTLVSDQLPTVASKFLGSAAPNAFTVHGDDAPTFYLAKKGAGALGQTDPDTRDFERKVATLTAMNPYTGATDSLLVRMADQTGMKALHMFTTGDPARNATFVYFADADYFLTDFPASTCRTCINPAFAWNHGDIQPEIAQTWLGFVGPGVRQQPDLMTWTDHADVRPTMMGLLGLHDDYAHDGRLITQLLSAGAVPPGLAGDVAAIERLTDAYKQVNAPFGAFATHVLAASTNALVDDDAHYASIEASIADLTTRRDALDALIRAALDGATFAGTPIAAVDAAAWMAQAQQLVDDATALEMSSGG